MRMWIGLPLAEIGAVALLAGCAPSTRDAPETNDTVAAEEPAPVVPPPAPDSPPPAPRTPTPIAHADAPPPEEPAAADDQMQDDADATGMTARSVRDEPSAANETAPAEADQQQ